MSGELLLEKRAGVAWLTIHRPEAGNALTMPMYHALSEILDDADRDRTVRSLVIAGGGRNFSAGGDIAMFRNLENADALVEYDRQFEAVLKRLEGLRVPTIAAVAGAATGGGAALAISCDFRIGASTIRFGFPIARTLGNCLSIPLLARLVSTIGFAKTQELIFSARLMGASEALQSGVVNELVTVDDQLLTRAEEWAHILGEQRAPLTLYSTRESLRRMRERAAAGVDNSDLVALCNGSRDFREGVEAFLGGRQPNWTGE